MADLAAGASVSLAVLYPEFPGKEGVLRAVADGLHAQSPSAATEALEMSQAVANVRFIFSIAQSRPSIVGQLRSLGGRDRKRSVRSRGDDSAFGHRASTLLANRRRIDWRSSSKRACMRT